MPAPICAERPLAADEADEQHQDHGHVPEVLLLHDGHAAAQVRDVLGQRRGGRRRVEAAAGVFGDAAQERRPHRGVEVLAIVGRRAHERAGALRRVLARASPSIAMS